MKIVHLLFIGMVFVVLVNGTVSFAQSSPRKGLEVSPAYTDVTLSSKDSKKTVTIEYTNYSDESVTLNLSLYQYQQQDQTGATLLVRKDNANSPFLSHFSVEPSSLVVQPHETGVSRVSITNREDLSPGGHYAAVVAQISQEVSNTKVPLVSPSISALILLKKEGGEKYGLDFKGVQERFNSVIFSYPNFFHLQFKNTGNIHLIVYGTVEEKDMFGRQLFKGVVNTSSLMIFPKNERSLPVQLNSIDQSLPISLNTLVVKGNDSLHKVSYAYEQKFIYVNILFIVMVILAVSVVGALVRRKFHRKK